MCKGCRFKVTAGYTTRKKCRVPYCPGKVRKNSKHVVTARVAVALGIPEGGLLCSRCRSGVPALATSGARPGKENRDPQQCVNMCTCGHVHALSARITMIMHTHIHVIMHSPTCRQWPRAASSHVRAYMHRARPITPSSIVRSIHFQKPSQKSDFTLETPSGVANFSGFELI